MVSTDERWLRAVRRLDGEYSRTWQSALGAYLLWAAAMVGGLRLLFAEAVKIKLGEQLPETDVRLWIGVVLLVIAIGGIYRVGHSVRFNHGMIEWVSRWGWSLWEGRVED